jgi:hypothetical protein
LACGYQVRSAGQAAAEIEERLMRFGRHEELVLSFEQERALGDEYLQNLREEYGIAATHEIARRVYDALGQRR